MNNILLIDDNEADNYFHKIIIEESGIGATTLVYQTALDALTYLASDDAKQNPPDIIFLDINMPAISGWEFLERLEADPNIDPCEIVIVMLSTSINPADQAKTKEYKYVRGYLSKPLTEEALKQVQQEYFSVPAS